MHAELEKCLGELEDLNDEVRARAVAGLTKIGDPVAFLVLDRIATADASIQLRFSAKKSIHQLQEALKARPPAVEISSDPKALMALLANDDPAVRAKCLDLCMAARQLAAMPFVPPMLETESDPRVKRSALLFASLAGRHAIRVLSPFVEDTDPDVRHAAVTGLGIIDDVDIFPHAVSALSDGSADVQRAAFRICSRVGKANFHRVLERMAASTKPWKRLAVARALSRIRQPHLRPLVEKLSADPDPAVQQAAASALQLYGPAAEPSSVRSAPPVPPASRPDVPAAAPPASRPDARPAVTASPAGPAAPAPSASPKTASSSGVKPASPSGIRASAGDGAGKLQELLAWVRETDTAKVPEIQEWFDSETDPRIRATLVMAAGKLGGRLAVDMLKKCLGDADGRIRANAVEALRGKVRPDALAGLLNDSDNRCRANAIVALKDHKRVDLVKHLKDMANGDAASRKSCIYAIVELGTPQAIEVLKRLEEDMDADVAEKAKQAREILAAREAEALARDKATAEAAAAAPAEGAAGGGIRARIAEAFGAFRKKLGK